MQISSFVSDSYIINLCLGYQLCLICPLILLYFSMFLHRNPGIFSPYVWTLPSKSYLPFCLIQVYSYLRGQGGDVTITDASREKEQDFAFPDGVSENMKNLTDIRDVHPGVLLDYLVKPNDFNKKILQSVGTLHKKCNELATKLCAVSTSEATNDRLPLPQIVQAQSRPAFDVASSERSKEVELESRVDAIEQRSNANILLCSGAIISEVIGADSGDLKNKVISCVGRSLPITTEDGDIVKVSLYGKKKTHVKIECSSASVKKRIIASARHSKPVDIYFTEFLTKYRNQMLFSLRSLKSKFRDKISAVYTRDGNLFYKLHGDDGFKSVRNPMDVTMLERRLSAAE